MDILPFKLNFFKQVERFFTLRQLDKQYDLMKEKYDLEKAKEGSWDKEARTTSLNWSTWEIEKKILRWTFLNHKHLWSPITVEKLDFLSDIGVTFSEIVIVGAEYVSQNLISRGFAKEHGNNQRCVINEEGLAMGSLLAKNYKFKQDDLKKQIGNGTEYKKLVPKVNKRLGYLLLYISSLSIILWSIFFLCLNVIEKIGLLDNLKARFNFLIVVEVYIFIFLLIPIITFVISVFLISFHRKPE